MAHTTPCNQCSQSGLPILFTRYAAAYSATQEGMDALDRLKPAGTLKAEPGGVSLKTAKYNFRMLRTGYLYLRRESICRLPEWLAFVVHPHGYLTKIDINHPEQTTGEAACRPNEWGANRSLVWIKDADDVTKLHFMFHPDPIDPEHLKKVIGKDPEKYMQVFDVAAWVKGATGQSDTMLPETLGTMVMEFKALSNETFQKVGSEQTFGLMGCSPQESGWGDYSEVREGRHYAGQRHESRNTDGTVTTTDGPGLPGSMSTGTYVADVLGHPYDLAHGPRLREMLALLQGNKGAVVACDDPIGIAQELSMHHLTAATPYVSWLQERDAKGISNQCKQAAAESIHTLRLAMKKSMMTAYDGSIAATRRAATNIIDNPSGGNTYKVSMPDSSIKVMTEREHNRYLHEKWVQEANRRDAERAEYDEKAMREILDKTDAFCDLKAIATFNVLHSSKLKARDKLLDAVATDLHAWFEASALVDKALGRYNPKVDPSIHPDGHRCAGQLCALLMQVASAPKGRQWYSKRDPFKPGEKNLVWRMLSFNSKLTSEEIKVALAKLDDPLPPPWQAGKNAESNAQQQKSIATAASALDAMSKFIGGADKVEKATLTLTDKSQGFLAKASAWFDIGNAARENFISVLLASSLEHIKSLPASEKERQIARAQVMVLGHGMAGDAARFVRSDMTGAVQGRRVPAALGALTLLGVLPSLAKVNARRDARSFSEFAASTASAMGMVRQWNADVYETAYFKQVPALMDGELAQLMRAKGFPAPSSTAVEHVVLLEKTSKELLRLKALAANYVTAGAAVSVWWDAVDATKALEEDQRLLTVAYGARAITGASTIVAAIRSARLLTAAMWLTRVNIGLAVATTVLTYAIAQLKGDAWANWLKAQPFGARQVPVNESSLEVTLQAVHLKSKGPTLELNKKTPFGSEREMMAELSNVLSEMN